MVTGWPVCGFAPYGHTTAVALDKGAKADQRDAVLAMQGLGDFFQHCIENAVGLFFGLGQPFSDSCGEIGFTHDSFPLTVFVVMSVLFLYGTAPKAPQVLNCGRPGVRMARVQGRRQPLQRLC